MQAGGFLNYRSKYCWSKVIHSICLGLSDGRHFNGLAGIFATVDATLDAIVTSHTKPKCKESAKIVQIINCCSTILIASVFPVLLTNHDTAQIWRC